MANGAKWEEEAGVEQEETKKANVIDITDLQAIRQAVLDNDDRVFETIEVPEWGVTLPLISLSMEKRRNIRKAATKSRPGKGGQMVRETDAELLEIMFFIEGVRDHKTENQIFTKGDAKALEKKNSGAISRVASKIMEMSGLNAEDADEEMEELKND